MVPCSRASAEFTYGSALECIPEKWNRARDSDEPMSVFNSAVRKVLAHALVATVAVTVPLAALAQVCPQGYYYASDGNCYPGPPPTYAPPAYDTAPPVSTPPVVTDGLLIGLGVLLGGLLLRNHSERRGRGQRYRRAPRRSPPGRNRRYEQRRR